jgi:hypothetical protein
VAKYRNAVVPKVRLWFFGILDSVVWKIAVNILEEAAASIFRVDNPLLDYMTSYPRKL